MNSGVNTTCMQSDTVDQIAGTRTLPSPRSTLSSMPTVKVMIAPPNSTSANTTALASTSPCPPIQPST